ncbi:MAG: DUF4956 domain-containing protein [Bacteroidetes bacterium]|nr:DUF4956 domain-containing protein [Bacteroidota bacterium]
MLLDILSEPAVKDGITLFEKLSFKFFIRLAIDIVAVFVLVRFIYYPNYKKKEFFFTFFIFNLIIFLISFLLNKVEMSLGAAFGLFAVFSMLRYRTEGISLKDMTYLFLAISIGLITAITKGNLDELALLNFIILGFTYLLESDLVIKKEFSKQIVYENIENIKPENKTQLLLDLERRTGLKIVRISILKIDFLKDVAIIQVFYYE